MEISKLINRFVTASIGHGEATRDGDYRSANRCFNIKTEVVSKLDELERRAALLELLDHQSSFVRCAAAARTLKIDEERATATLEELSKEPGLVGFDAEMILKEWRKGNLEL